MTDVVVEPKEMILDSDTHCIEKPDTWTSRLPKKWGDQVMHMVYDKDRELDIWKVGDNQVAFGWPNAYYMADCPTEQARRYPPTQAQVHPACYDAKARVEVMDRWGVESMVLFPNSTGFSLEPFMTHPDADIANAHITAYNDFLIEEWVDVAPGRFLPMAAVAYWDIPAAVKEIERIATMGFGGITTTGAPQLHGQPYLREDYWDPMWSAAQAAGLPVAFHVGNGDNSTHLPEALVSMESSDIMETRVSTSIYLDNARQTVDLLLSGILVKFPDLKFIISESGVGWVPFILENCDHRFKKQRVQEFGGLLPSDLFKRQISVNFFFEQLTPWHIDRIGAESILFQTDLPHPTGFYWTGSDDFVNDALEPAVGLLDEESRRKVLWENGERLFRRAFAQQRSR
jgi:predicted TIM-barrel fold metal-dependent hydrolase